MYTATRGRNHLVEGTGQTILAPCLDSERDGCIWYWGTTPSRIVWRPVRVVGGKPRQPKEPLWDDDFLHTADVVEALEQQRKPEAEQLIREQLDDSGLADEEIKN